MFRKWKYEDIKLGESVMIRLLNVIDTRTGKFHSDAIVSEKNLKYFVDGEGHQVPIINQDTLDKAEAFDILMGEE